MEISTIKMIMEKAQEGESYVEKNLLLFPLLGQDTDPVMLMQLMEQASHDYQHAFPSDYRSEAMAFIWVDLNFPDRIQECVDVWTDPKLLAKIRRFVAPLAQTIGLGTHEKMSERKAGLLKSARSLGIFIPDYDMAGVMTFKLGSPWSGMQYATLKKQWRSMQFRQKHNKISEFYYADPASMGVAFSYEEAALVLSGAGVDEQLTDAFGSKNWNPRIKVGSKLHYKFNGTAQTVTLTLVPTAAIETPNPISKTDSAKLQAALVAVLKKECPPVTFSGMPIKKFDGHTADAIAARTAASMETTTTEVNTDVG
jgi:hypothetical protein